MVVGIDEKEKIKAFSWV